MRFKWTRTFKRSFLAFSARLQADDKPRSVVPAFPLEGANKFVEVVHGVEAESLKLIRHLDGQGAHEVGHPFLGRELLLLLGYLVYLVDVLSR